MAMLLIVATTACAQAPASAGAESIDRTAATISAANLRQHLEVIAHDSMRGRDTPSPELMQTARYIAREFESYGLEPGAGDDYLQLYPLTRVRPAGEDRNSLRLSGPGGDSSLRFGEEFFVQVTSDAAAASGELVLVNRAADMAAARGKIGVLRVTAANVREVFGGRIGEAVRASRPLGLIVALDLSEDRFERFKRYLGEERQVYGEVEGGEVPVAFASHSALPPELAAALEAGEQPAGWSAHLTAAAEVDVQFAPNTIGLLRGTDPVLKDEYVLLTAHMDHVGVREPVDGDSIFNGADDDGSGTVTIVELARAFAAMSPGPRRSIIFMTVSGEEKGLLGSRYYAEHPTFPLEKTVANINMDMVGRNWSDTIVAIGKEESTLGPLVERLAADHPELDMAVIDDLWPSESFYTRSDHYNFARRGVPILFFFNGTHDQYHRPGDEVDLIDYDKMARIARLVFYLGVEVANDEDRPAWDAAAYERVVESPRS